VIAKLRSCGQIHTVLRVEKNCSVTDVPLSQHVEEYILEVISSLFRGRQSSQRKISPCDIFV